MACEGASGRTKPGINSKTGNSSADSSRRWKRANYGSAVRSEVDTLDDVIGERSFHARSWLRQRENLTALFSKVIRHYVEAGNR